jgi:ATP-dependent Clp protease ATP-binding subunit ClpC
MFERFTDAARFAVVAAQEAARELNHDYIGTEHFLLGLLRRPDTSAARALATLGISADTVRRAVIDRLGTGAKPVSGHIPFTPRGKSTLEHALREALTLNHSYIGTEHILLGLLAEPDGFAAQILAAQAEDLSNVRAAVLDALRSASPAESASWEAGRRTMAIRTTDDRLILEVTDPSLVELARAATTALGDQMDEPGTISGELPAAASLAAVWHALRNSLEDIRRRATPPPSDT